MSDHRTVPVGQPRPGRASVKSRAGEIPTVRYWRRPLDSDRVLVPLGEVIIVADRCKGCGFCVEYCPQEVLVLSESFNRKGYHPPEVVKQGECLNCNLCEMICPEFAIFSVAAAGEVSSQPPSEETSP